MPEVIEVLKYADFIRSKLKGNKIVAINVINGRYKKHGDFENLDNLRADLPQGVTRVETKGKFLYMQFQNQLYLFSTLGLSGGWLWKNKQGVQFGHLLKHIEKVQLDSYHKEALNHCNVEFVTEDGTLYFYDTLSFGTLKIATETELQKKLATIGPDISQESTTFQLFKTRFAKVDGDKLIGNILLNQRIISGIGNYLRADVLWLCKISPFRKLKDISEKELQCIWQSSRMLTWAKYNYKKGLKMGFIEAKHEKTPEDYGREFYVYMQMTDPAGRPVKKEELFEGSNKRFIHWVPEIQD